MLGKLYRMLLARGEHGTTVGQEAVFFRATTPPARFDGSDK